MVIVMDVDEIHMLEYEPHTMQLKEEGNCNTPMVRR
jgi:hypothetical protein